MILFLVVIGGTLAFLVWLIFSLASYALPCFVGISTGMLAHAAGAGAAGAMITGFAAAVIAQTLGRTMTTNACSQ